MPSTFFFGSWQLIVWCSADITFEWRCFIVTHPRSLINTFVVRCLDSINISSFYIRNFKSLAGFCGCAGRFAIESYLVENPEDRFSRDEAHLNATETGTAEFSSLRSIHIKYDNGCKPIYFFLSFILTFFWPNLGSHNYSYGILKPRHDKTNKVTVRPAKTQISLDIHPVFAMRLMGS